MCRSIELRITRVDHPDSGSTDMWVEEWVEGSQSEIVGMTFNVAPRCLALFDALIQEIV